MKQRGRNVCSGPRGWGCGWHSLSRRCPPRNMMRNMCGPPGFGDLLLDGGGGRGVWSAWSTVCGVCPGLQASPSQVSVCTPGWLGKRAPCSFSPERGRCPALLSERVPRWEPSNTRGKWDACCTLTAGPPADTGQGGAAAGAREQLVGGGSGFLGRPA